MRYALFFAIGYFTSLIGEAIKDIADTLIVINGLASNMILKLIDKERVEHAEMIHQQIEDISELSILKTINEIRNEAMTDGQWNEQHENKLNILGTILANEYDWEVEQVERYLYEVIETGPSIED